MNKKLLLFCAALTLVIAGCSREELPIPDGGSPPIVITPVTTFSVSNVLQSNMVIQRDKPFLVWGQVPAGHKVTVTVGWNNGNFSATADIQGNWKVTIPAAPANNTAQLITCTTPGFADAVLKNILIGDVWLCSGQSNMTMPMDAIAPFTGVLDYQAEISASNHPDIRAVTISEDEQPMLLTQFSHPNVWVACSPQTTGSLSAVAYYFAQKINATLNVPVGIIISSVSGSWCEEWIDHSTFVNNADIKDYGTANSATQLYNGMINPLANLQLKGFVWYQGENNQNMDPVSDYTKLNSALIKNWRTVFNDAQLPFYFVQLTPFAEDYYNTSPPGGDLTQNWLAKFREAQANILAVSNTGMAITMDVGEAANHHPRNKKPVGERLALLALKNTYGQNVICYGPRYLNYTTSGSSTTINFANSTADGLTTINNQPLNQLFFVAGTDNVFTRANAQISGNTIIITAPASTPLPIQAIRYAFTNVAITNIQNGAGLPMEPFRTDNWDN